MKKTNYRDAIVYAKKLLTNNLDTRLIYHSIEHTRDDVVYSVMRLSELADISIDKRNLLMVAAWYHDIGYIKSRAGHEKISVEIVNEVLPQFGFSTKQLSQISTMIMATKIPQSPKNFLSKILLDADLDNLGRYDFFEISKKLKQELNNYDEKIDMAEWWKNQLIFLETHQYFTKEAQALRGQKKKENIQNLEKKIAKLSKE